MSRPRIVDIVALASEMTVIAPSVIMGRSRLPRIVRVRQACMTVAREAGHSYPMIGHRMDRDHSTVVYGVEKAGINAERDKSYAAFLDRLRKAAAQAKPLVTDRAPRIVVHTPEPIAEPTPEPEATVADLDEVELLSRAVAAHYATA